MRFAQAMAEATVRVKSACLSRVGLNAVFEEEPERRRLGTLLRGVTISSDSSR